MLFTPNGPALEFGSTGNSYIIIVGSLASDIRPQDIVQCINYRAGSLGTLKILRATYPLKKWAIISVDLDLKKNLTIARSHSQ